MPKLNLIRSETLPYHVTARSNNKDWFHLPLEQVWQVFSNYLHFVSSALKARVHGFVLMANHFHLIVSTPEKNLDHIMLYLMRETSRSINKDSQRINHVYGGAYKWTLISKPNHYHHTLKYVYRNPIKAGLVCNIQDYPYSSARGLLGGCSLIFPVLPHPHFGGDVVSDINPLLSWLNSEPPQETNLHIGKALQRSQFKFYSRNMRTLEEIDQDLWF